MSDDTLIHHRAVKPVLDYPCGDPPAAGTAQEIAPGVLWLRMPLPFALDHINLWAVRDDRSAWAAFDSGTCTPQVTDAWNALFDAGGMLAGGLTRLFVTHMHPDHVGMAGWLTRKFNVRLWMTRLEYLTCRTLVADTGREAPADGVDFYRRAGWSAGALEHYRTRFGGFGKYTHPLPDSYRRVQDGETLRIGAHDWRVVVGHGHSPEHACFHCPDLKLLISGDQVLPRISSNVSLFPTEPDADPLGEWLASLAKLKREVPDDVLVLPSHNEPFRGLHARLDYLAASQHEALGRLRLGLTSPKRAIDVFAELFSRPITRESGLLGMATGESLAHLNYLLHRGEATKHNVDGVDWYRSTAN
jgi:glyoxylase-like metal-dependent hydrolase (beta-lactamase superfamily II)